MVYMFNGLEHTAILSHFLTFISGSTCSSIWNRHRLKSRATDNFQVQRVITPYFWKWWIFAYFLCTVVLSTSEKIAYMYQGSPHLQKIGRLDFSLREHEGEVKAWQGDMFSQKCGFFHFFLHLKCVFANILFISFIFNIKFMFCFRFIIIIDLVFIDFRFIHFCQKKLSMTSKCSFPSPDFLRPHDRRV